MDEQKENKEMEVKKIGEKKDFKAPKIIFETHKNLPEEAKEIIGENLPERDPKVEIPIPEGKVVYSETKWIEEQADGEQQKEEWQNRETGPKDSAPMNKLSQPLQAYSYGMKEPNSLEGMMWNILERIGFVPTYHARTKETLLFELGGIHRDFLLRMQEYVETKDKDMETDKIVLCITGPGMSGKSYILNLITHFLRKEGITCKQVPGIDIHTEHRLKIEPYYGDKPK